LIGKLEESLFLAAAGDDGLGGGIVVGAGSTVGAFGGMHHCFDVIFGVGAKVEVDRYFFYGGVWDYAFDGADGRVVGARGA
jgi:hypothetical protein